MLDATERDSSNMRRTAILTAFLLPATFFAVRDEALKIDEELTLIMDNYCIAYDPMGSSC
jgi:hypothetical protein